MLILPWTKGEHANIFLFSPQITNPEFLGLFPLLQIRKFLRCAILQIAEKESKHAPGLLSVRILTYNITYVRQAGTHRMYTISLKIRPH